MRLRSFRLSLATFAILMVVPFCLFILVVSYFYTSATVEDLTGRQFREVSRRQVLATRDHLHSAIPALAALDSLLDDQLAKAGSEERAKVFLGVLRANPDFTWVSYSDAGGGFTGVYRDASGAIRINRSTIHDGKTELFEHEVQSGGTWREIRHDPDSAYDPRTRAFYTQARDAGHRIWTKPYVFYGQAIPGITYAVPHYGAGHRLEGVLTIDFDLNALSAFTRSADLSKNGVVFIFTTDGTLLGHPNVKVVAENDRGGEGKLLTVSDVNDERIHAFAQYSEQEHTRFEYGDSDEKLETFTFRAGGSRYLASFDSFEIDLGTRWVVAAIAPEADFIGSVRLRTAGMFAVMLLLLLIVVAIVTPISARRFARPLDALAEEMERIGRFDLAESVLPPSRVREIVTMNQSVAMMKSGLRSFARYVPRDLVRAVLDSGQEAVLGGRTKEMTVFFSAIEGFTSIAETMEPSALVLMLGEYLDEMTRVIASTGGTVDKFLGDGILAFWGAPIDDDRHAMHAAEAALACRTRLEMIVAAKGFGGRPLRTRIGLATGPVLVGNIGTPERMNYTVMGDTANLASRLESLNKAYGSTVLVGEETAKALEGRILARPVDVVAVNGKARAVKVFELLAKSDETAFKRVVALAEDALAAYLERDFATAVAGWSALLAIRPGDSPATVMRARAEAFLAEAPPAGWNGIYVAREK